ncbi:hypothetical protein [Streptomyces flavidovirens]|uniref:hypothetical protein n=1 Tax=Streptomyces flavidovirens TaxID=67298 RepID=UPI00040C8C31|nr:hypothetical protein [Streptomyces flavidovirens]
MPTSVELTGEQPRSRFGYRDLELATVGGYLLLAGSEEALARVSRVDLKQTARWRAYRAAA